MMEYIKLQLSCVLIILYIAVVFFGEKKIYKFKRKDPIFTRILIIGFLLCCFDLITEYTINHREIFSDLVSQLLNLCAIYCFEVLMFLLFIYVLKLTYGIPKRWGLRILISLPMVLNILISIIFIFQLQIKTGRRGTYVDGISFNICFLEIFIYLLLSTIVLTTYWKKLERHTRTVILNMITTVTFLAVWQIFFYDVGIISLCPVIIILSAYLNHENPAIQKMKNHNKEVAVDFAIIVENKDGNTGGHIKRTTDYVNLLANELRSRHLYYSTLTKNYIEKLSSVAALHDIGKIAIPDAILQKPGKLTQEEFEIMKTHTVRGGKIIKSTLTNTGDIAYEKMAYEVAMYHHEKWNGNGYPEGLTSVHIPLAARIMAVADVFDAISSRRCYRDAMPLEECFDIIKNGSGKDFDPIITRVFLEAEEKVIAIYKQEIISEMPISR